jgi:hypothetical protein
MNDYYYKGIHYTKYQSSHDKRPVVKLTASDFKLMMRHIKQLEIKVFNLTGEHFGVIKDNSEEDFEDEEYE